MKHNLMLLTTVFMVVLITPAFAQWDLQARTTVPFEFSVGTTLLPAGTYEISTRSLANTILLKNVDSDAVVYILENNIMLPLSVQKFGAAETKLVFRQDGNDRVLHRIQFTGDDHIASLLILPSTSISGL